MKEEVRKLWKLCFGDSEEFMDIYFAKRYSDERNIAIAEEGHIVSALQLIPYPMQFGKSTISTSYISGVCTHPDYRNKGVGKQLMQLSLEKMFADDIALGTLIPAEGWLAGYYRKMGFEFVFDYSTIPVKSEKNIQTEAIHIYTYEHHFEEVYRYFDKKQRKRTFALLHTADDLNAVLDDLQLSGGQLFIASKEGKICGLAFCVSKEENTEIIEFFADDTETEENLLLYIGKNYAPAPVLRLCPVSNNGNSPHIHLGMARIIHAEAFLKAYAETFPAYSGNFYISDKQLPANNGHYHLENGKCIVSSETILSPSNVTDIHQLTEILLKPLFPYMSLMMN